MKKLISIIMLLMVFSMAMAQHDPLGGSQPNPINQNSGQQDVLQSHNQDQNFSGTGGTPYQHASNQNGAQWNLYSCTTIKSSEVPQTASGDFTARYPDEKSTGWYKYDKGYIASCKGEHHIYEGVIYDQNGNVSGTVQRVKYLSLASATLDNIDIKYPGYETYYIYEVRSTTGVMTYVSNVNGKWIRFSDQGIYVEEIVGGDKK